MATTITTRLAVVRTLLGAPLESESGLAGASSESKGKVIAALSYLKTGKDLAEDGNSEENTMEPWSGCPTSVLVPSNLQLLRGFLSVTRTPRDVKGVFPATEFVNNVLNGLQTHRVPPWGEYFHDVSTLTAHSVTLRPTPPKRKLVIDISPTTAKIYAQIVAVISAQLLVAGERLGTERELAERLNVSRALLRQALEVLENENLIKRLIGRGGGIFVSDGKVERELNWIVGVPTFLRQQGFRSRTKIIYSRLAVSAPDEARVLCIPVGSPIFEIRRVRFANDVPLSLETARLPAHLFPGLLSKDLSASLYTVVTREYGHVLARADEYIEARLVDDDEAALLEISKTDPVLEFRRVTTDADGVAVEHARDVFRADRIRVSAHASGQAPNTRVADRERRIPHGRPRPSE